MHDSSDSVSQKKKKMFLYSRTQIQEETGERMAGQRLASVRSLDRSETLKNFDFAAIFGNGGDRLAVVVGSSLVTTATNR